MEDMLYDIHLSQNLEATNLSYDEKCLRELTLRQSIMDKYGVTQAQWDSSLVYYCRHTEELYDIYQNISERLRNDVLEAGGEVDMGLAEGVDTSDVWKADRSFVLMQYPPYNLRSFTIEADSTFKAGDRLILSFMPQFIYQDGMRDITCVFTATLKNDSVISEVRHCNSSDMRTTMTIEDRAFIGVKNIRLYFMCSRTLSESLSSTLRIAFVNNIKLIHNHNDKEKKTEEVEKPDTLKVQRDSAVVNRPDLQPLRPHAHRPVDERAIMNGNPHVMPLESR